LDHAVLAEQKIEDTMLTLPNGTHIEVNEDAKGDVLVKGARLLPFDELKPEGELPRDSITCALGEIVQIVLPPIKPMAESADSAKLAKPLKKTPKNAKKPRSAKKSKLQQKLLAKSGKLPTTFKVRRRKLANDRMKMYLDASDGRKQFIVIPPVENMCSHWSLWYRRADSLGKHHQWVEERLFTLQEPPCGISPSGARRLTQRRPETVRQAPQDEPGVEALKFLYDARWKPKAWKPDTDEDEDDGANYGYFDERFWQEESI